MKLTVIELETAGWQTTELPGSKDRAVGLFLVHVGHMGNLNSGPYIYKADALSPTLFLRDHISIYNSP